MFLFLLPLAFNDLRLQHPGAKNVVRECQEKKKTRKKKEEK